MATGEPFPYLVEAFDADFEAASWGDAVISACADGRDLTLPALRSLLDAGVPRRFAGQLTGVGDLAVARVEIMERSGRFEFGGPDQRLILTVRDHGEAIDLVALSSRDEGSWSLWLGQAEFLGFEWLARAQLGMLRELRLFRTPMGWLRAGGAGICVLDWNAGVLAQLRGLGSRVTLITDPGARERLQGLLTHGGLPLVAEDRTGRWEMAA